MRSLVHNDAYAGKPSIKSEAGTFPREYCKRRHSSCKNTKKNEVLILKTRAPFVHPTVLPCRRQHQTEMLFPKRQGSNTLGGRPGAMGNKGADQRKKMPTLPEFVAARDWTGALGLLKFELSVEENLADEGLVTERVSMSCKQSDCRTVGQTRRQSL